jgi:hypothetical protein
MKTVVIRDRQSGGNTEIYPIFEDNTHWYVLETQKDKKTRYCLILLFNKFVNSFSCNEVSRE